MLMLFISVQWVLIDLALIPNEKWVFWISLCVYFHSCGCLLEAAVTAGWYICDHTHTQPLMRRLRVKSVILRLLKLSRAPEHVWSPTTQRRISSIALSVLILSHFSAVWLILSPLCRLRNCCVWILLDSKFITLLPSLFSECGSHP